MENKACLFENGIASMIFSRILLWVIPGLFCMALLSCSTMSYREVYPTLMDGKYDSEFPYRGCSSQLEQISESVKMVSTIAYYKSYFFPLEEKVRKGDLNDLFLNRRAIKEVFLNRTSSGSATVISYENKRIAMLTCAHVVDFEDTIITYHIGENRKPTEFINSFALKDHQTIYVAAIQGTQDLEILAIDKENDMAVIGQKIEFQSIPMGITIFNYPIGKAKELECGVFVYLFGYPSGFQIITKAIVSNPNRDRNGSFLTDAVVNKGFSGGIILAVRDGVPNFELVGMVKRVPGYQLYYLNPIKKEENVEYDPNIPFKGDIYVDSRTEITYGVAPAIPSESIVEFLTSNQQKLLEKGYEVGSFLSRQSASKQGNR